MLLNLTCLIIRLIKQKVKQSVYKNGHTVFCCVPKKSLGKSGNELREPEIACRECADDYDNDVAHEQEGKALLGDSTEGFAGETCCDEVVGCEGGSETAVAVCDEHDGTELKSADAVCLSSGKEQRSKDKDLKSALFLR